MHDGGAPFAAPRFVFPSCRPAATSWSD